jgi:hypothetical protein
MSLEQVLNSQTTYQNYDSDEESFYTEIDETDVYIVSIDDKPIFWTSKLSEATDQATDFLRNLPQDQSQNTYYIDEYPNLNQIRLVSVPRFGILKYERVENVANIYCIPKIQFVKNDKTD